MSLFDRPVARDSTTRRGIHRQGRRRYEVAAGDHFHELPGEVHWLITNSSLQTTNQLRNAGILSNSYAVLNGAYTVSAKDAPKLAKLWGVDGSNNVVWPDLRDRSIIGYGNVLNSGQDDGLAFGANRTNRAKDVHGHTSPAHDHGVGTIAAADHATLSWTGSSNTTATGTTDRVQRIEGSNTGTRTFTHNFSGRVGNTTNTVDNFPGATPNALGGVPVVKIQ